MQSQLGPQGTAVNRVHAMELASELTREFSKQAWREASATAMRNWLAAGHSPQRLPSASKGARRPRYAYSEEE